MRKRFVKVVLLGALAFATTTSFISCKDYDDDINRIDDEIGQINQSLDELKTSIGNAGVKSVTYDSTTGKLTIVDSNDKSVSCTIAQNLPEYTVEVADGKIVLKKCAAISHRRFYPNRFACGMRCRRSLSGWRNI